MIMENSTESTIFVRGRGGSEIRMEESVQRVTPDNEDQLPIIPEAQKEDEGKNKEQSMK